VDGGGIGIVYRRQQFANGWVGRKTRLSNHWLHFFDGGTNIDGRQSIKRNPGKEVPFTAQLLM
jgi:hypothetical protein